MKFLFAFNVEHELQQSALMKISIMCTILAIIEFKCPPNAFANLHFGKSRTIWVRGRLYREKTDALLRQRTGSKCSRNSGLSFDPA
jgi:hypothetical protein